VADDREGSQPRDDRGLPPRPRRRICSTGWRSAGSTSTSVRDATSSVLQRVASPAARRDSSIARAMSLHAGVVRLPRRRGLPASDPSARSEGRSSRAHAAQAAGRGGGHDLLDSIPSRRRATCAIEPCSNCSTAPARGSPRSSASTLSDLDFDEELILVTGKGSKQRLVPMGARCARSSSTTSAPGDAASSPTPSARIRGSS
jgi:hypothetical protein